MARPPKKIKRNRNLPGGADSGTTYNSRAVGTLRSHDRPRTRAAVCGGTRRCGRAPPQILRQTGSPSRAHTRHPHIQAIPTASPGVVLPTDHFFFLPQA